MAETLCRIEVTFGTRDMQRLIELEVPPGTTISQAVQLSGIAALFPEFDLDALPKGVWNKPMTDDHVVRQGDRVEVYRPLVMDPKTARRKRAEDR